MDSIFPLSGFFKFSKVLGDGQVRLVDCSVVFVVVFVVGLGVVGLTVVEVRRFWAQSLSDIIGPEKF